MKDMKNVKPYVVITYIDRINEISDIFFKYYLSQFNTDEFYFLVLDSNKDEILNYLTILGFNEHQYELVTNNFIGKPTLIDKQNKIVSYFIEQSKTVIYVDIDEILYHNNIKEYFSKIYFDYLSPMGVVLIPKKNEDIINFNENVLGQINYCVIDNEYHSKVCVLNKPYIWNGGRHNKNNVKISEDIFLIDFSKCSSDVILKNNIKSTEIYQSSTERYSEVTLEWVYDYLNKWRKKITTIPKYILDKNLF